MGELLGKVAVVTGASRGIGAAIAIALGTAGASVVVNYRNNEDRARSVSSRIEEQGGKAIVVKADIARHESVRRLFKEADARFGRLDILVNNAGIYESRPLEEIDEDHVDRQFAIMVRGLLFATQQAARRFRGEGCSIVNISSGAAQASPPGASVYSASKAAVEALTRSHAAELGGRGITVNAVAPGLTSTEMLDEGIPAAVQERLVANTALHRLGTPQEIAEVVLFLVSGGARWITGQVIGANGGLR